MDPCSASQEDNGYHHSGQSQRRNREIPHGISATPESFTLPLPDSTAYRNKLNAAQHAGSSATAPVFTISHDNDKNASSGGGSSSPLTHMHSRIHGRRTMPLLASLSSTESPNASQPATTHRHNREGPATSSTEQSYVVMSMEGRNGIDDDATDKTLFYCFSGLLLLSISVLILSSMTWFTKYNDAPHYDVINGRNRLAMPISNKHGGRTITNINFDTSWGDGNERTAGLELDNDKAEVRKQPHNDATDKNSKNANSIRNEQQHQDSNRGMIATTTIPHNLIIVTDRLPGDAKIHPRTLENAGIWQDLYKSPFTSSLSHYKMHYFPTIHSIETFFTSNTKAILADAATAPKKSTITMRSNAITNPYLEALHQCENEAERFDFARLVILYVLGGIAVDITVTRPLERLDGLLDNLNTNKDKEQLIVSLDYSFDSLHDSKLWAYPRQRGIATHCIAATPRHPVVKRILDTISYNLLHREEIDNAILQHGYSPEILQDVTKTSLLRRMWTTGSGPVSDVIFATLNFQTAAANDRGNVESSKGTSDRDESGNHNEQPTVDHWTTTQANVEVILLPRETFMSAHPGGMRFHSLQQSPEDVENILYLGSKTSLNNGDQSIKNTANAIRKTYLVYDESHLPPNTHHSVAPYTYLIGAVRDASHIAERPFEYIVELSCVHGVHVHIVVGGGVEECRARFDAAVRVNYSVPQRHRCGRFELLREPADLHSLENRVDRIAYLRDFQREHLRVVLENGNEDDIIVVADLDLHSLPPVKKLMHEVIRMRQLHEYDVVCSNGLMHRPHGYYDLYATVLLPDTFLYPIRHRLIKKSWEGEDLSLIRSFDEFGEVTSWDVLDWVAQEGERRSRQQLDSSAHQRYDSEPADAISANPLWRKIQAMRALRKLSSNATLSQQHQYPTWYQSYNDYEENDYEPSIAVPVRSCFGGLTIYSAKALLEPSCRYHPPTVGEEANRLLKYANLDDKRPCEHVVFHDCLFQLNHKFGVESRIAIQPDMQTMWNDTPVPRSKLISDSNEDAIITFYKQSDRGDKLTSRNGRHSVRTNKDGILVIESCESGSIKKCLLPQVRALSVESASKVGLDIYVPNATIKPKHNWSHMFLILESDGNLILLKQVPKRFLKDGGQGCGNTQDESCQLEVWSSKTSQLDEKERLKAQSCDSNFFDNDGDEQLQRFEAEITDKGYLEIRRWMSAEVIWRSNGVEI